ncbi:MAG TPA: hypothetical protein VHZ51_25985 [Ktedonobacteraceae bacterium]|jgi:hypothetical protein|nr:hypothetical protein [Ktedonobacteraceae bacterium]
MRKGAAILLLNMLASELGYTIEWPTPAEGERADAFRLDNYEGDTYECNGPERFEQAVKWLRAKV